MRKIKRENCCVLPLTLKGKWFNMIAMGGKEEEYRTSEKVLGQIDKWLGHYLINGGELVVELFLGYQKDRPKMAFIAEIPKWRGVAKHPEWGEPNGPHYVIPLGEIVELV